MQLIIITACFSSFAFNVRNYVRVLATPMIILNNNLHCFHCRALCRALSLGVSDSSRVELKFLFNQKNAYRWYFKKDFLN